METAVCSAVELLLTRYDQLQEENTRLRNELERERTTNKNYWDTIPRLSMTGNQDIGAQPCPFCGSHHVGLEGSTCASKWFIMCDCGAMGPECNSEADAIYTWNKAPRSNQATRRV